MLPDVLLPFSTHNLTLFLTQVSKLTATGAFREYVTTRIKNLKQLHKGNFDFTCVYARQTKSTATNLDTPSALSPNPELRSNSSSRSGRDSVSSVISPGGSLSDCRPAGISLFLKCYLPHVFSLFFGGGGRQTPQESPAVHLEISRWLLEQRLAKRQRRLHPEPPMHR